MRFRGTNTKFNLRGYSNEFSVPPNFTLVVRYTSLTYSCKLIYPLNGSQNLLYETLEIENDIMHTLQKNLNIVIQIVLFK